MVAKSIAKMYTNIHKPTDYSVKIIINKFQSSELGAFHFGCIFCSAKVPYRRTVIKIAQHEAPENAHSGLFVYI